MEPPSYNQFEPKEGNTRTQSLQKKKKPLQLRDLTAKDVAIYHF
jgi:hypothetical protein